MPTDRLFTDWSTGTTSRDTVVVEALVDETPVWSGLLDARGVRLYRVPQRHPVGFHDFSQLRVASSARTRSTND